MRIKWAFAALAVLLAVSLALLAWAVFRPRIVARATAPNGTEIFVVQRFLDGEPWFNTSFFYRTAAGQWGWCYFDHEDNLWSHADIVTNRDARRLTVLRDGTPAITFDWETETYVLLRWNRTNIGVANWLPAGSVPDWWTPSSANKP
jgi:hypothetical protein